MRQQRRNASIADLATQEYKKKTTSIVNWIRNSNLPIPKRVYKSEWNSRNVESPGSDVLTAAPPRLFPLMGENRS